MPSLRASLSRALPRRAALALAAALALGGALAQDAGFDPGSVLSAPEEASPSGQAGLRVELWRQEFDWRELPAGEARHAWRGVLDYRHEWTLNEQWKFGLSNRFEAVHYSDDKAHTERNVLREAYASHDGGDGWHLDAGRINSRQGMASGYNPSDFLRAHAVVTRSSQDPAALRENRLGTVMLRAQKLGAFGSLQATLVPRLSDRDTLNTTTYGLGLERTNRREALLLRYTPRGTDRLAADVQAYVRAGDSPQVAANLSFVAADSLLLHAEWAGGKQVGLTAPDEAAAAARWSNRLATGFSWTTPWRMTVTIERLHNSQGLTRGDWKTWRAAAEADPATRGRLGLLRREVQERQELLVRDAWFARLAWDQAFEVRNLDIAAIARINAYDRSRTVQLDAAWHLDPTSSLRLILGHSSGARGSEFASALRSSVALYWLAYF